MNTEREHRANLLFLLSLPLLGCPGDDATAETGASTSASTIGGTTFPAMNPFLPIPCTL